jgi:eukaryotic-like serine/threonine-protein kinase
VLREVVVPCSLLDDPFLHTRAELWLGQALEDTGDKPAACAAYRVVLDRWGGASPRSVTADTAARRVAALQCPR